MTDKTIQMFQDFDKIVWGDIKTQEDKKAWFDIQALEVEESRLKVRQNLLDSDFVEWYVSSLFKDMKESEIIEEIRKESAIFKYYDLTDEVNKQFIKWKKLKGQ